MRTRALRWLTAVLLGVTLLPALPVDVADAQASCQFERGFAALRGLAGAGVVGNCLENEQSTINGDVLQTTTNGLMAWRKIDNYTAFTDGARTWLNGPTGLAVRFNGQRFPWEGDRQAMEELQRGGLVVFLRHGATDRSQADTDSQNLANCATQRNLNDQGRTEARRIGEVFRVMAIPVGQVLSSEYCRAREFAQLAFGRAESASFLALPDPPLPAIALPAAERQQNAAMLRERLGTVPAPRTVTVMVSHQTNMNDALETNLSVEGEAAVFRPDGRGGSSLVARFVPQEWVTLAQILTGRQITS